MISVSNKFLEIVKSNVRPQILPQIKVSGTDVNGNNVSLTWKSSNITEFSYKRGIDPTGQTLPYMELTWKEFYFGKLNAQNYPEKYENLVKYMVVELSFTQKTSQYHTWNDFKALPWGSLGLTYSSWGDLFKTNQSETVTLPSMFLVARPTVEGHTITWTARDLLYFLNENVSQCFASSIPWRNQLRWLLLNEIGNFSRNFDMVDGLKSSNDNIKNSTLSALKRTADSVVICEGITKDLLKNLSLTQNCFVDFTGNKISVNSFLAFVSTTSKTPVFKFTKKIMREYPKLTTNTDISSFSIKRYYVQEKTDEKYQLEPAEFIQHTDSFGTVLNVGHYIYKGYGLSTADSSSEIHISKEAYNKIIENTDSTITVTPVEINDIEMFWDNNEKKSVGETYVEDNPVNYLDVWETASVQKRASLNEWYSSNKYSMEINSLSNVALETGDLVEVETNLYNNSGNYLTKRAIIVGIELTYNGVLKQKTLVHEVN